MFQTRDGLNISFGVITMFQTRERFKRTLFIRTKHSVQIFRVIPFIKLQNESNPLYKATKGQTTVKW